ncbi:GTP 3',8-cyclase MoaA [Parvimonas micra]|uniref:GTP 3',8-cyclase n=1 Tax=Parvimonas micra TaxID=33033 RepID=A0AAX3K6W4_9FIRM|nr:GTP 3',8-cyclase MoaA [Parvimonas micra]WBB30930.1 GTP 3',8-cyclase MoaA [Parvimonas micra]
MKDRFGRNITYLRISVTDLCNLRCKYCMPESGIESLCHSDILSIEEIVEIVKVASKNGIKKIRLTGGEPLVRRGFINLCKQISKIDEIEDIAITTNGVYLKEMADELFENKVRRINFSLDTLIKEKYNDITRRNDFDKTMESLFYVINKGFKVKINVVLIGGFNDDEIQDFVNLANKYDLEVRFIELMQIGETANWSKDKFVSNKIVLEKVPKLEFEGVSGVAKIYKIKGQKGRIGLISPISCSFCEDCNRIRLTSDGKLKPCLHSKDEINLKGLSGEELEEVFKRGIYEKPEKHHLEDGKSESARDMNKIGG